MKKFTDIVNWDKVSGFEAKARYYIENRERLEKEFEDKLKQLINNRYRAMNNTGKPQREALPPGTAVLFPSGERGGEMMHGTIIAFDHSDHYSFRDGNYYKIKPSPVYSNYPSFCYCRKVTVRAAQ